MQRFATYVADISQDMPFNLCLSPQYVSLFVAHGLYCRARVSNNERIYIEKLPSGRGVVDSTILIVSEDDDHNI